MRRGKEARTIRRKGALERLQARLPMIERAVARSFQPWPESTLTRVEREIAILQERIGV